MLSRLLKQLLRRRINVAEIDIVASGVVLAVVLVVAAVAGIVNITSRFSN